MGEDRTGDQPMTGRRVTVAEAADILGISVEAVRGRIKRDTIGHERDGDRVVVILPADRSTTSRDQDVDQPSDRSEVVMELRERVEDLREQLAEEREARRRADTILAQLARANEEQARTIRELEAPSEPPPGERESTETVDVEQELDTERARREMAETTLHEGMDEERRRREEAERERDGLRRELFALRGQEEAHEAAEEQQGRGETRPATGRAPESSEDLGGRGSGTARGSWWRRMFGR